MHEASLTARPSEAPDPHPIFRLPRFGSAATKRKLISARDSPRVGSLAHGRGSKIQIVPPVNIPIPTKIGSKMVGSWVGWLVVLVAWLGVYQKGSWLGLVGVSPGSLVGWLLSIDRSTYKQQGGQLLFFLSQFKSWFMSWLVRCLQHKTPPSFPPSLSPSLPTGNKGKTEVQGVS